LYCILLQSRGLIGTLALVKFSKSIPRKIGLHLVGSSFTDFGNRWGQLFWLPSSNITTMWQITMYVDWFLY